MNLIADIWQALRQSAETLSQKEPFLADYLDNNVLSHHSLSASLAYVLSQQLIGNGNGNGALNHFDLFDTILAEHPAIVEAACCDLTATFERDPAIHDHLSVFLNIKGFMAIQCHRIGHVLYQQGRYELAYHLQSKISRRFAIDIHPAARLGKYLMFDHGTGIVIGETCIIEDKVSILQNVTLGGSGKETGDRHPKIKQGVMIGAGAIILGNVTIGQCAKVGAGSVVLKDVPAKCTVVGVPAKLVGKAHCDIPSEEMDQNPFH